MRVPLDDTVAACGFEAHINAKHVVGVVKEKEQARQRKLVEETRSKRFGTLGPRAIRRYGSRANA